MIAICRISSTEPLARGLSLLDTIIARLYVLSCACISVEAHASRIFPTIERLGAVSGYNSHNEIDFGSKLALLALLADIRESFNLNHNTWGF